MVNREVKMTNKYKDTIDELHKLSKYTEILECPDEFFVHMQGHRTELSLVLSAFDIVDKSSDIIEALEKQISKKCFDEIDFGRTCPICRTIYRGGLYCVSCGQRIEL
jgi:hypothetical protein